MDLMIMTDAILGGFVHHKFNHHDITYPCPGTGSCRHNWTLVNKFLGRIDV